MSLRLEAIYHVVVIGTDYACNGHFYAGFLGPPVIREYRHEAEGDWKISLQLGDTELELFIKPDASPRKSYSETRGPRHPALRVTSVMETTEALRKAGIRAEPLHTDAYTGKTMCFFSDLDGFPFEPRE